MREESQAPRNSRELAVRNQFFTPRYVVQFLTDNTLGRIWYEMRGTNTVLAERCEYMVRKPGEEFAPRAKKDPRDLRVLDPACGSGHFLLYAFDLLLAIYEEAYADPESPKSEATGRTLAEDYPSLDALRKAVPAPHPRAQPPRRGHRPALRADRPACALDARAARVPRVRDRSQRSADHPALEHRHRRADAGGKGSAPGLPRRTERGQARRPDPPRLDRFRRTRRCARRRRWPTASPNSSTRSGTA